MAFGKLDVSEIFEYMDLAYFNITDEITESQNDYFWLTDIVTITTRPTYPSSKLTFSIANATKNKDIRFLTIGLTSNKQFDVEAVLEDSKRDFLNSFLFDCYFLLFNFKHYMSSFNNLSVSLRECSTITRSLSRAVRFSLKRMNTTS